MTIRLEPSQVLLIGQEESIQAREFGNTILPLTKISQPLSLEKELATIKISKRDHLLALKLTSCIA